MRKFLLLFIAVSCLMMVIPQLVSAQSMSWFVAQHRIYEDGRDITRVIIQLVDLEKDDIDAIRFYEPGDFPTTPSPLVTKANAREFRECTNYSRYFFDTDGATPDYWDWQPVINAVENDNWNDEYYLSWNLSSFTLIEGGTYRIEVDYGGSTPTTLWREFTFSAYYPLPIVSLVSDKERIRRGGGGKLNVEELSDGSLVLRWHAAAVAHEDTSARVFVLLEADPDDGECYRHIAFKAPTQMGMLIMPSEAVEALMDSAHYNGYFGFTYQIRVNDNSERSYSLMKKYYP